MTPTLASDGGSSIIGVDNAMGSLVAQRSGGSPDTVLNLMLTGNPLPGDDSLGYNGWSNIARINPDCIAVYAFPLVVQPVQVDGDGDGSAAAAAAAAVFCIALSERMLAIPWGAPSLPVQGECYIHNSSRAIFFGGNTCLYSQRVIADMCVHLE
ncbi:hypothetical protein BO86DRAFT_400125 [Aspergillus japonicus CBS 114.51]|uniref:Uncharacterized protein n=1 Tax=Aspergillus japonicus CBS 114.51 TaxID=1448312 RepID=A0A8T8WZ75_ASPJA|nr:hypothetical protein BO86DRAFT_400125 [Aspergillus japonicus CBS 114.51]RAH81157.1 hypothetical protein BO86DRAFT_400125 [Aspergillus japonicus CBS 114.51]